MSGKLDLYLEGGRFCSYLLLHLLLISLKVRQYLEMLQYTYGIADSLMANFMLRVLEPSILLTQNIS